MGATAVNIPATGAGDAGPIPVAVDDVAGTKYQQMKLVDSTIGSTAPVGTATNPLQVKAAAGVNLIGMVITL